MKSDYTFVATYPDMHSYSLKMRKDELLVELCAASTLSSRKGIYNPTAMLERMPTKGNFIFLRTHNATLFRKATPKFSTLNLRRKKSKINAAREMSTNAKIRGLRNVLKKHIDEAPKIELVDEPEGVQVYILDFRKE